MATIAIKDVKISSSVFEKSIGLIGKNDAYSFLLNTRFGIHTFFLAFPIDVLVLDEKYKVVKKKENLKPNRLFFWNVKYKNILELPNGTINQYKIKLNDIIDLKH